MPNPLCALRAAPKGVLAAVVLGATAGCAGLFSDPASRPLRTPPLHHAAEVRGGTALSGADEHARDLGASADLVVRCRALWVERTPAGLAALDQEARLLVEPDTAEPVRVVSSSAGGIGCSTGSQAVELLARAEGGALGRFVPAWDEASPLPEGCSFRVRCDAPFEIPAIAFVAWRGASGGEASVGVELEPASPGTREALVLADRLKAGGGPVLFALPRSQAFDEPAALLVAFESSSSGAGADLERAVAQARASAEEATARRSGVSAADGERREIRHALSDLERRRERRKALVFLADRCGAPLALDAALVAPEPDLAELAHTLRERILEPRDRLETAWTIERAAWELIGRRAAEEKIAPELAGILVRHGGEAARLPASIEDLLRSCASVAELEARLLEENRILLEDASPAARVRAYDWLLVRGAAPEGYDPLAPIAERRAVLDRFRDGEEAPR